MMKKEVAPIVCRVQFISPPSEIVAVDKHKAKQASTDKGPNLLSLLSDCPFNSKDFICRKFLNYIYFTLIFER